MHKNSAKNHKGFEYEHPFHQILSESETDKKIREFAKFVSEEMPSYVACFNLTVTRDGYVTQAVTND